MRRFWRSSVPGNYLHCIWAGPRIAGPLSCDSSDADEARNSSRLSGNIRHLQLWEYLRNPLDPNRRPIARRGISTSARHAIRSTRANRRSSTARAAWTNSGANTGCPERRPPSPWEINDLARFAEPARRGTTGHRCCLNTTFARTCPRNLPGGLRPASPAGQPKWPRSCKSPLPLEPGSFLMLRYEVSNQCEIAV